MCISGGVTINSKKLCTFFLSAAAVFSMMVPVQAKSSMTATSSGSTSGNQDNTIRSSVCKGSAQLSGIDAQIFAQIVPDHEGVITCAKSDGFKTVASNTNQVNNYHWVAWYKNTLEEDVDRIADTGNYHGFTKDKVIDWERYEDNIRKLNGGRFPERRDYLYPTDTKDGVLSFWGDIAGYYGILGDPQYDKIHLEAYQQFSYRVEKVYENVTLGYDDNYCEKNPDKCAPEDEEGKQPADGDSNDGNSEGKPFCDLYPDDPTCGRKDPPKGETVYCAVGQPYHACMTYCTGSNCADTLGDAYFPYGKGDEADEGEEVKNPCIGTSCYTDTQSSTRRYYAKDKNGYATGWYFDVTTVVERHNETKQVKVADAYVGANAYATEIASYERIALKEGSAGTLTYAAKANKFWETTPRYWVNQGKQTISNDGAYPYHFASEGAEGSGKNNINLYALIKKRDKFYNVIHGYPDITEVSNLPKPKGYPATDESCVEVLGKTTCSDDKTPLIEIEVDLDKDEAQAQVEVDRFVHLVKDRK